MDTNKINRLYSYNTARAKQLRNNETEAEKILWQALKNRNLLGLKFRRQHPICNFVVDFYCHEKKLIIELEGKIHEKKEQKEYDDVKKCLLESWSYNVLTFKNKDVFKNLNHVLSKIIDVADKLVQDNKISSPSPFRRGLGEV